MSGVGWYSGCLPGYGTVSATRQEERQTDRQTDNLHTFTEKKKKIQSCCPFLGIKKQLLLKKKLQKNIEVIFFLPNVKLYPRDMRLFIMKINIFIPGARS